MRRLWIIVSCLAVASVTVFADDNDNEEDVAGPYGRVDAGAEDGVFVGSGEGDSDDGTEDRRRKRDLYGTNAYAGASASGYGGAVPGYAGGFGSRASADASASSFGGVVPGYHAGLGSGSSAGAFAGSSSFSGGRIYPPTSAIADSFANTHVRYAAPVVQKHFYYHAAPQEHKATAQADTLTITPRKHYKIIFIKAPSVSADAGAAARAASQIEEKTIVYVLTNKPAARANAGAQADASTFTSGKPEVYFIKYQGNDAKSSAYSTSSGATGYGDASAYSGANANAGYVDGGFGARSGGSGIGAYPDYSFGSSYSEASANAGSSVGGFGGRSGASGIGAYPGYAPNSRVFF
ncbi:fibroin heavy chain-like [Anopheles albimanus]|uniref:DM5 domain-containing protein n=1 Tax=Anopheles albimanus TaxID=7167 RepID=A0A182FTB6_ANOAL|nr:fibroin heavy chain-like [Anopheles albimanus]